MKIVCQGSMSVVLKVVLKHIFTGNLYVIGGFWYMRTYIFNYVYIFIWCIQAGTQLHSRPEGTGHVCQIQEVRHTCQDARGGLFHYHHNSASDRHQGTQNPSQRHCIRCIYFRIVLVAERGPFRALRCPSV